MTELLLFIASVYLLFKNFGANLATETDKFFYNFLFFYNILLSFLSCYYHVNDATIFSAEIDRKALFCRLGKKSIDAADAIGGVDRCTN